jgi:hypothetical protein
MNRPDLYLVWKGYQRRAEVLAPNLDAELVYLPHIFKARIFRGLDYIVKHFQTLKFVTRRRPRLVFLQAPPQLGACALRMKNVPFVLDTHNAMWQSFWNRIPGSRGILEAAEALLVHNDEIAGIAKGFIDHGNFFTVRDPIEEIKKPDIERQCGRFLFICSFDRGEPVEVIADVISQLPDIRFVITADIKKTPQSIQKRFREAENLELTGFLDVEQYHLLLCSAQGVIVLDDQDAIQPSGACEALSSDTHLIVSRSSLTECLFGEWAHLVRNDVGDIVRAIHDVADSKPLDLRSFRYCWNDDVRRNIADLKRMLASVVGDT